MGKHKTKEEWLYWFKKYKSKNFSWDEYFKTQKIKNSKDSRRNFRNKLFRYNKYGEYTLISMSGKNATGRKKLPKVPDFDKWSKEDLAKVARRYFEITKEKPKREKNKEVSSLSFLNLSKFKIAEILSISRSGLYYSKHEKSKLNSELLKVIKSEFTKNNGIYGRDRISAITGINYRRVGRYMNFLGLKCKIRQSKRNKEIKHINTIYTDLVKRNYSMKNVIATDVSYIKTNKGFAYLSAAINHETKKIESWNFSKNNDLELVLEHFKNMDLKNKVVHSDHGFQYSSNGFKSLSEKKEFKISMSRIGNALDNREIEYFFSNLKSECLNIKSRRTKSFDQTKVLISNYICWYNNKRPQSSLNWKTPKQYAQMFV